MATKKAIKTEAETQSDLLEALKRVSDEKSIPVEALVGSIEGSLASAYKKAYGGTGEVRVAADLATNEFRVFAQKRVVQTAMNTNTEVAWREARVDSPGINLGDTVEKEVTPSGFGRIAAQTAKQVLLQKLREAERVQVVSEYADKSGQMFRGVVQRMERGNIIVAIGKAEAILPRREQVPGENYRFGDSLYVYVVEVRPNLRGPSITISRTHPGLVRQLFVLEVPEIADGIVELKAVTREAGQRTKIAVAANNPDVDPVGACVGPRGMRVGKVVDELGNEKVDIVRWNADAIAFITNALSPAQISKVMLVEDSGTPDNAGTATVIVAEDQQSLAIGKQGQNVRLAAKLTGWKIDIRTEKQYAEEQAKKMFAVDNMNGAAAAPVVTRESQDEHAALFAVDGDAPDGAAPDGDAANADAAGDGAPVALTAAATPGDSGAATTEGAEIAGEATDDAVPADLAPNDEPLTEMPGTSESTGEGTDANANESQGSDDGGSADIGSADIGSADIGSAAPLDDIEFPGPAHEVGGTSPEGVAGEGESNGDAATSDAGDVSSVAPAGSLTA